MHRLLRLRNKIIHTANNVWTFGCFLHVGQYRFKRIRARNQWGSDRLITGVHKDGRAILIYIAGERSVPNGIADLLHKYATLGGVAGVALSLDDAWEILYNGEEPRKRKARTYEYRRFITQDEE